MKIEEKKKPLEWFNKIVDRYNLADLLDDELLDAIGQQVKREYDIDLESRAEWDKQTESALKLAKQVVEDKTFPWPGAANVKYPLMTVAALQFNARAYPEIINGNEVVRCRVNGEDPDGQKQERADRISEHMSWQLLEESEDWEEGTDNLLLMLPIIGNLFRKTERDHINQCNVSELLTHESVCVSHKARSLSKARRISHRYPLWENDIYERVNYRDGEADAGIFLDVDLPESHDDEHPGDEDAPVWFIEQHRYLDLDGDGYAEPYIVTIHEETTKVVRIVANFDREGVLVRGEDAKPELVRIIPNEHFTQYRLFPNPDGGLHGVGFGQLLNPLNESINTILNQLLDAGTLNNTARGWIRGLKNKGVVSFQPGEWKPMPPGTSDARIDFFPIPSAPPSDILFQLLGLLVQAAQDITSVKDVMTGEGMGANVPATTTLAMVEQGMKVFSAIYKRVFRSLTQEFRKLYRLNSKHMDDEQYFRFHDSEAAQKAGRADYTLGDLDVCPVADPRLATDAQRLARANALASIGQMPGINPVEVTTRVIDAINPPDKDKLMLPEEAMQAPPDPKAIEIQARIEMDGIRLEMERASFDLEMEERLAKIGQIRADTMLKLAQAEAQEVGQQFELYKQEIDMITTQAKMQADLIKAKIAQQTAIQRGAQQGGPKSESRGMAGVAGPSGNGAGTEPDLAAMLGGGENGMPGPAVGGEDSTGLLSPEGIPGRPEYAA